MKRFLLILPSVLILLLPACTRTVTVSSPLEYATITDAQLVTQTQLPPPVTVTAVVPPWNQISVISIPFFGTVPATTGHAPDEVVSLMSKDFNYLDNITPSGGILPEPRPIPIESTSLQKGTSNLGVHYRQDIKTPSGETRNNIVKLIFDTPSSSHSSSHVGLELYLRNIPGGFSFSQVGPWNTSISEMRILVLTISVSADVKPGRYSFDIGIVADGVDYGTLPCTVTVMARQ